MPRNWNKLSKNNLLDLNKQSESDEDDISISLQTYFQYPVLPDLDDCLWYYPLKAIGH